MFDDEIYLRLAEVIYKNSFTIVDNYIPVTIFYK